MTCCARLSVVGGYHQEPAGTGRCDRLRDLDCTGPVQAGRWLVSEDNLSPRGEGARHCHTLELPA